MLKTVGLALLSISIALIGGAWSVIYALDHADRIAAVTVGPWTAHPSRGTPEADPYTKASFTRSAELSLGGAEGIEFRATRDSAGVPLDRRCTYRIGGFAPTARFWTLHASTPDAGPLPPVGPRLAAVSSLGILYEPDGSLVIAIGPDARPGNWLPVAGDGVMSLILTLYDTPIANRSDVAGGAFPLVDRMACRA